MSFFLDEIEKKQYTYVIHTMMFSYALKLKSLNLPFFEIQTSIYRRLF